MSIWIEYEPQSYSELHHGGEHDGGTENEDEAKRRVKPGNKEHWTVCLRVYFHFILKTMRATEEL